MKQTMSRPSAETDGVVTMSNTNLKRGLGVAVFAALAVSAVAGATLVGGKISSASADQAKTRCVRAIRSQQAWRARYVETNSGSDGKKSVVRTEITVRQPGDYRVEVREHDDRGREVVSESIRTGDTLYTRRIGDDGSAEMHVMKGVRPSLGIEMDNALGETIQAVADSAILRVVGTEQMRGRRSMKLELAPGHYVWTDEASGLPLLEQEISGGVTTREVTFESFDSDSQVAEEDFTVAALGSVESTVVEDLGFRAVSTPAEASDVIGFRPVTVSIPAGYQLDEQGYCDPRVSPGDREAEAAFVTKLFKGSSTILVTQTQRPGLGDVIYAVPADEPDAPRMIDVAGRRALIHSDESGGQLMLARRDILVTVEGNVADNELTAVGRMIR